MLHVLYNSDPYFLSGGLVWMKKGDFLNLGLLIFKAHLINKEEHATCLVVKPIIVTQK